MKRLNISIIGAGNLGTIMATKFSQENNVVLYANRPKEKLSFINKNYTVYQDENISYTGNISAITNNIETAVKDVDYIFITYPSYLLDNLAKKMMPFLKEGQHLVFVPGCGGVEFYFNDALKKGVTISGLQRVHAVARIIEEGKSTKESGIKKELFVASIPNSFNEQCRKDIEKLFNIKTTSLPNYLNVTLINSNPLLHTSRLYVLFKEYPKINKYKNVPLFYEEWDLESSIVLAEMDKELCELFNKFYTYNLPITMIKPIMEYYDSKTPEQMTNKLRTIKAFKGIQGPIKQDNDGLYMPDLDSRYFKADFTYGLDIILELCELFNIPCKKIKDVSSWYHKISNTQKVFSLNDLGVNDITSLINIYK